MVELMIKAENLSKQYEIARNRVRYSTFREKIVESLKSPFKSNHKSSKFWALKDVSFEIYEGETVGIIGRNGAGKSTLLKILSRITKPTSGRAELYGRIGSLLEIGTGFHPELTGRENIFLNGAILGMRNAEIARKFDEIVDFAEIEKFIETPVKHYSSGMHVRLAFAVASTLEPEILVIDEVLAVGDANFQKKCLGKIDEVSKRGRTVLFVSHQMGMIAQLCESCILLEKGKLIQKGKTDAVINEYLNRQDAGSNSYYFDESKVKDKSAYIIYQKITTENGVEVSEITNENPVILETKIRVEKFHNEMELSLSLQNKMKGRIFTVDTPLRDLMRPDEKEKIIRLEIPANFIAPNLYSWISSINISGSQLIDVLWDECDFIIRDVGTKFASHDGRDYGCILLNQYKLTAYDSN